MFRRLPRHAQRRGCASPAVLWPGCRSKEFTPHPVFKTAEVEFPVLRQLSPDGHLAPGVDLPFDADTAKRMYKCMVRSSVFDERLNEMQRQGRITFYCTNFGEEAASVGTAAALDSEDMVWPQYRELAMFLWRGLTAQAVVDACIGNEGDVAKGRALPVHYILPNHNVQVVHAVLGTHISQAPGAGYAYRLQNLNRCSVAYFGDGAASEGDALSALNYASLFKSQTLFICRNNGYSISTPVKDQYAGDGVGARGPAFDIPTIRVDGNDVVAVFNATREAREMCVKNKVPVFLELMTYRVGDHTTSDNSSLYRPSDEKCLWEAKGLLPIQRFESLLLSQGILVEDDLSTTRKEAQEEIMTALKEGERKLRAHPTEMFRHMYDSPPWHLREQSQEMMAHIARNRSKYDTAKYRDL
eukprot:Sspe_Gene.19458::Locus_7099_Transcript_3_8_Confidence_0.333_Length_1393::g.19458::m.19458/K00166/BCKDHA, bkdA1; 2-oxoisovalerate dehydrogenase E1 component alpha subunit